MAKIKLIATKSPYHRKGHVLEIEDGHVAKGLVEKGFFSYEGGGISKEDALEIEGINGAENIEDLKMLTPTKDSSKAVKAAFGEKMKSLK